MGTIEKYLFHSKIIKIVGRLFAEIQKELFIYTVEPYEKLFIAKVKI